ncbi:MAG: hypothetical protein WBF58_13395 [Xanthobacteraceae bacterium]
MTRGAFVAIAVGLGVTAALALMPVAPAWSAPTDKPDSTTAAPPAPATPPAQTPQPATPGQSAAPAAATVFPVGSRFGLVPPPGMIPSKAFPGFVAADQKAAIIITALPLAAVNGMQKALSDESLKRQGITVEKRQALQLPLGKADLIVATQLGPDKAPFRKWLLLVPTKELAALVTVQVPQQDETYSDSVVRAALATVAVRETIPETEYLSLLPFTIGSLSGFHIGNIIPGRAVLLVDAPQFPHLVVTKGLPEYEFNGRFIITAVPGGPIASQQRVTLARDAFRTIQGLKDVQITMSEPVRTENKEDFETVASAKDSGTGAGLMVIQWLRFGNGGFLQMVGVARADIWESELTRMRAIRDGIAFK